METRVPPYIEYYDKLLALDLAGARGVAEAFLADQGSVESLYVDLFDPALVHAGLEWQRDRISIAHEHFITEVTRGLILRYGPKIWQSTREDAPVGLACCVPGERHTIGLTMVTDMLRAAGWMVQMLGEGLPAEAVVAFAGVVKADFIFLSCGIDIHLPDAADLIQLVRQARPEAAIAIGGAALREGDGQTALHIGADFTAPNARVVRQHLPEWIASRGNLMQRSTPAVKTPPGLSSSHRHT